MKLGLGLGLVDAVTDAAIAAPSDIFISNDIVLEDLAIGLTIGTLSADVQVDEWQIILDADSKFDLSGIDIISEDSFDYEQATTHQLTIRAINAAGSFDKILTINISDVADEETEPELPPEEITPVYSGTFSVTPVATKGNGKTKVQGKASSIASFILDIGALVAGYTYIARYDPDFSLLSNTGKEVLVGFGLKAGNDFHLVGLKGDGSTGLNKAKIYHSNWNNLSGATISVGDAASNGTQAGPNWIKIVVSEDGSTYTLYSGAGASVESVVWNAEYTDVTPDPLAAADDATTFGLAVFLPASDTGQFSIELDVWQAGATDLDPHWSSNVLLLGFEGLDAAAHTTDETGLHGRPTFIGNAQIDTAEKKFGTSSLLLDGSADGISFPDSADWDLSDANSDQFTIEAWIRPATTTPLDKAIVVQSSGVPQISFFFWINTTGAGQLQFSGSTNGSTLNWSVNPASSGLTWTANQWYHVAVDKDASGKVRIYRDGVMVASGTPTDSTLFNSNAALTVGIDGLNNRSFNGHIDEVRITKGVARYASDAGFTPPSAAFLRKTAIAYAGNHEQTLSAATTYTSATFPIGPADPDRVVSAYIHIEDGTRYITGVTIGGVAAKFLSKSKGSNQMGYLYAAIVPTGETAAVVATLSAASSAAIGCMVHSCIFNGAGFASLNDAILGGGNDGEKTTDLVAKNIPAQANGFIVAYGSQYGSTENAAILWGGSEPLIEDVDADPTIGGIIIGGHIKTLSDSEDNDLTYDVSAADTGHFAAISLGRASERGAAVANALDANDKHSDITLSGSDLIATRSSGGLANRLVRAKYGKYVGKYYFEFKPTVIGNTAFFGPGVALYSRALTLGYDSESVTGAAYYANGTVYCNGSQGSIGTYAANDIVCVALDLENDKIWFRKNNGNWDNNASHDPAGNVGGYSLGVLASTGKRGVYYPAMNMASLNDAMTFYPAAAGWTYAAPSGFSELAQS